MEPAFLLPKIIFYTVYDARRVLAGAAIVEILASSIKVAPFRESPSFLQVLNYIQKDFNFLLVRVQRFLHGLQPALEVAKFALCQVNLINPTNPPVALNSGLLPWKGRWEMIVSWAISRLRAVGLGGVLPCLLLTRRGGF